MIAAVAIVACENLCKTYRVSAKRAGVRGTLAHFVRRKYREIPAVRDVSLSIEPGEVVGFLGANGAGKTTTLKMLTGLMHPSSGTVVVAGFEPFKREAEFRRRITLVMGQKQQLLWDLPAMDSLRVNAALYDIPRAEAQARIAELTGLLNLEQELTQPVRKLSLGQRMKAELVAALLHHPRVLFLDEPTLGLDVNAQTAVRSFLAEYNAKHGAAILLTSHYMADVTALCKRVILIHEGRLVYDGPLAEIVRRYAPFREVKLDFGEGHGVTRAALSAYGEVEAFEGREARLLVPREGLTATVNRLLAGFAVHDLTVQDPPIEGVMARLMSGGEAMADPARGPGRVADEAEAGAGI